VLGNLLLVVVRRKQVRNLLVKVIILKIQNWLLTHTLLYCGVSQVIRGVSVLHPYISRRECTLSWVILIVALVIRRP
jgi:hypothetical protein